MITFKLKLKDTNEIYDINQITTALCENTEYFCLITKKEIVYYGKNKNTIFRNKIISIPYDGEIIQSINMFDKNNNELFIGDEVLFDDDNLNYTIIYDGKLFWLQRYSLIKYQVIPEIAKNLIKI